MTCPRTPRDALPKLGKEREVTTPASPKRHGDLITETA